VKEDVFCLRCLCLLLLEIHSVGFNPFSVVVPFVAFSHGSSSDSQPWAELWNPFGICICALAR